jgi:molybdopterin-guanine dinucleotide biosynthesis protein B
LRTVAVAVVGGKKSGKTIAIELLTKELTSRGYRVAAVKHIPEPSFTIDKEGKDTWRFAQAGAKTVVAVSADEIATIEKVGTEGLSVESILLKCAGSDVVFLEGFRNLVAKDRHVYKIVVAESAEDVAEATRTFDPILVFTGAYVPQSKPPERGIPYVDVLKNPRSVADLVERAMREHAVK